METLETPAKTPALSGITSTKLFGIWIDVEKEKPKPGRKVLVCGHYGSGNRWRALATWWPAGTLDASMWDDPPEEWWNDDETKCSNPEDGWMEEFIEGESMYGLVNVTQWMPLPDMPNGRSEP